MSRLRGSRGRGIGIGRFSREWKVSAMFEFFTLGGEWKRVKTCLVSLEMSLNEILARLVNQISDRVPLRVILDPVRLQPKRWKHDPQELSRIKLNCKRREMDQSCQRRKCLQCRGPGLFHPDVVLRSIESAARDGSEFIILDHVHRVQFNPKAGSFSE